MRARTCTINAVRGTVVDEQDERLWDKEPAGVQSKSPILPNASVTDPLVCGAWQTKQAVSVSPILTQSVYPYWKFALDGAVLRPEVVMSARLHWNVRPVDNLATGSSVNFAVIYGNVAYTSFHKIGNSTNYQSLGYAPWDSATYPAFTDVSFDVDSYIVTKLNLSRADAPAQGPVGLVSQLNSQGPQNRNVARSVTLETCHYTGFPFQSGDVPIKNPNKPPVVPTVPNLRR
ncbi:MAG: hypothetical protein ABJP70_08445 [Erythrobacter sp.]